MRHNINLIPALAALGAVFAGRQINGHSGHVPGAGSRRRAAREAAEAKRRQAYYADTPEAVVSRQVIRRRALIRAKAGGVQGPHRADFIRRKLEAHRAHLRGEAPTPSATSPRRGPARPGRRPPSPGRAAQSSSIRTERA